MIASDFKQVFFRKDLFDVAIKVEKPVFLFYLKIVARAIFHSIMDSITIRKYKSEDYKDICRIFVSAHQGNTKDGIFIGIKSPYVVSYLTIFTMIGLFYSIFWGLVGLIVGLSFHACACFTCYNYFAL